MCGFQATLDGIIPCEVAIGVESYVNAVCTQCFEQAGEAGILSVGAVLSIVTEKVGMINEPWRSRLSESLIPVSNRRPGQDLSNVSVRVSYVCRQEESNTPFLRCFREWAWFTLTYLTRVAKRLEEEDCDNGISRVILTKCFSSVKPRCEDYDSLVDELLGGNVKRQDTAEGTIRAAAASEKLSLLPWWTHSPDATEDSDDS